MRRLRRHMPSPKTLACVLALFAMFAQAATNALIAFGEHGHWARGELDELLSGAPAPTISVGSAPRERPSYDVDDEDDYRLHCLVAPHVDRADSGVVDMVVAAAEFRHVPREHTKLAPPPPIRITLVAPKSSPPVG